MSKAACDKKMPFTQELYLSEAKAYHINVCLRADQCLYCSQHQLQMQGQSLVGQSRKAWLFYKQFAVTSACVDCCSSLTSLLISGESTFTTAKAFFISVSA